jgi:RimJ/RimL family protein N-acetyltransferase
MISFDRWTVSELRVDVPTISNLWRKLEQFPTLFSDETRGDIDGLISLVTAQNTIWLEIREREEVVGVVYFVFDGEGDADSHMVFFDRRPAEKRELLQAVVRQLFNVLPDLQRISARVPDLYFSTRRLVEKIGFRWQRVFHEDVMIGSKLIDVHLYVLTRSEANGLLKESGEGLRDSRRVYAGGASSR